MSYMYDDNRYASNPKRTNVMLKNLQKMHTQQCKHRCLQKQDRKSAARCDKGDPD